MIKKIARRRFLEMSTASTVGLALTSPRVSRAAAAVEKPVRVGFVGVGGRGQSLLRGLLLFEGVEIPAICDINANNIKVATNTLTEAGRPKPQSHSGSDDAYESLMNRDDLDAVVIATPWEWHTPMAVYGMKAGKYVAVEVPAALTMEECWDLVNTHEQTGVPCMMLENWSFRQDNLAVLNMIRKGLFGEMVHCHCAHSHDCVGGWFWNADGTTRWPSKYLIERNADQYPTHSLGPVLSWMDINCGDAFAYMTSTATSSLGINAYFARTFGPDHPGAKRQYAQGDIVTSVVKTHKGRTIVINYDMQLPRPYDNRWLIQGTLGVYNEQRAALYLEGCTPKKKERHYEWEPFVPYQDKFDHSWWKAIKNSPKKFGHGGTDYLELQQFIKAVRNKTQTPIDVYDSVVMSVIIPLSEQSIANGSAPVPCPDFTRGEWKTRKPTFAMEGNA